MKEYTIKELFGTLDHLDYVKFEDGEYNVNIIAVRNKNPKSDSWDDHLYVIYKENGKWRKLFINEITTDPGRTELVNPSFRAAQIGGTAAIKEGQYRGAYRLGFHRNNRLHPALIQVKPVTIYRDKDRDDELDYLQGGELAISRGLFGVNIHSTRPGWDRERVYNWSAGCIVAKDFQDFQDRFISLCRKAAGEWGNGFTLTLLTQEQIETANKEDS